MDNCLPDVCRCDFCDASAIIDRFACGLRIKLKQYSAERRFSAARLADDADSFALVNIKGYIFVGFNVQLFLLEN